MTARVMAAAVLAAGALCAQTLERSGDGWVETSVHALPAVMTQLRVTHLGPVRVSGDGAPSYQVRKRVKAASEIEARRLLGQAGVRWRQLGPVTVVDAYGPPGSSVWVELEVTVPVGVRHVQAETRWGSVAVDGVNGDVAASTAGGHIVADRIGGSLTAETGGGPIRVGSVGASVRAVTGGGPVRIRQAGAGVQVESGGGEIAVEYAGGAVQAFTGAGNIDIVQARASVHARTRGGVITVQQAGGEVRAENEGGATRVVSSQGVQCESAAGSIRAEFLSGRLSRDSILRTGSGDITVWLPSNLAVTVVADSVPGRLVSEFAGFRPNGGMLEGVLNGGGPVLRLESAGGTIYVRRR